MFRVDPSKAAIVHDMQLASLFSVIRGCTLSQQSSPIVDREQAKHQPLLAGQSGAETVIDVRAAAVQSRTAFRGCNTWPSKS